MRCISQSLRLHCFEKWMKCHLFSYRSNLPIILHIKESIVSMEKLDFVFFAYLNILCFFIGYPLFCYNVVWYNVLKKVTLVRFE